MGSAKLDYLLNRFGFFFDDRRAMADCRAVFHLLSLSLPAAVGRSWRCCWRLPGGAPFMPRHPTVYAEMLRDFMRRHEVECWLVNTGWSGGPYGVGERMSLPHTRALLHAALEGELANVPFRRHAEFGLMIPETCPGVPSEILDPKSTWADPEAYGPAARKVAKAVRGELRAVCRARGRRGQGGDTRQGLIPRVQCRVVSVFQSA